MRKRRHEPATPRSHDPTTEDNEEREDEDDFHPRLSKVHGLTPNALAAATIAFFTILHLYLAFRFPLAPDETYYWEWSRRPDWGYYDQGPMIAWWIRAGCILFGETQLGIRAPILFASAITQSFVYLLARDLVGAKPAIVALVVSGITPMALAGGFIATYDPLAVMFWTAALYFAARAILRESSASWVLAGVCFGLGLLSKHTVVLLAPTLLLAMLHPAYRHWLARPAPYAALLLGTAIYVPNLIWQSRHGWITFGHLFVLTGKGTDHGLGRRFGDFLGSQVGLMTPLLFFSLVAAMVWAYRTRGESGGEKRWFLFCAGAPILLLFLAMTAKSKVQANWAVTGWVTPSILLAAWLNSAGRRTTNWTYAAAAFGGFLSLLLVLPEIRRPLGLSVPRRWDQMNKLYGGEHLGLRLVSERRRMERETGRAVKLGATTYDNTSRISFYVDGQPEACNLFLGTRPNSYLLWEEAHCPRPGDNMILVDDHASGAPGRPPFEAIFDRVVPIERGIPIHRSGVYDEPVRTYYLYRCFGYRPDPAIERHSALSELTHEQ